MFTGIIEAIGHVRSIKTIGTNIDLVIESSVSSSLKIDQSISHNGVCLTVVEVVGDTHRVTAIKETLDRSNLGKLQVGDVLNLERAMPGNSRLDGHIVQGHVDATGECVSIENQNGSWNFSFRFNDENQHLLVDKGSICINGVSLTVNNPSETEFSVSIIPYTFEHTSFGRLAVGDQINLEFDIIGKYVAKMMKAYVK